MKSLAPPEPGSDFGRMPRPSPATARSKPAATPQTGPAVFSIMFFIQRSSTVIAGTRSAHDACVARPCSNYNEEIIGANSVLLPIRIPVAWSRCGMSRRRKPRSGVSKEGLNGGRQQTATIARGDPPGKTPSIADSPYPQSYPYLAERQSNIGRNALMAKGHRAVSRQNTPKIALTSSVTFGTLPTSRHDAGMRSDESANYVKSGPNYEPAAQNTAYDVASGNAYSTQGRRRLIVWGPGPAAMCVRTCGREHMQSLMCR